MFIKKILHPNWVHGLLWNSSGEPWECWLWLDTQHRLFYLVGHTVDLKRINTLTDSCPPSSMHTTVLSHMGFTREKFHHGFIGSFWPPLVGTPAYLARDSASFLLLPLPELDIIHTYTGHVPSSIHWKSGESLHSCPIKIFEENDNSQKNLAQSLFFKHLV